MTKIFDWEPIVTQIELTARCNQRCFHCYQVRGEDQEPGFTEVVDLLTQIREAGGQHATFTGGEPTLREDLQPIIKYAAELGFTTTLFTNGSNDAPDLIDTLLSSKTRVQVSLHGASAAAHESITGSIGSFERTVSTIRELRTAGIDVVASVVLMTCNVGDQNALIKLFKSLDVQFGFDSRLHPRCSDDKQIQSLQLHGNQLGEVFSKHDRIVLGIDDLTDPDDLICYAGKQSCFVSCTFELFPCLQIPTSAGNLHTHDFRTLWRESAIFQFLRKSQPNDLTDCGTCAVQKWCDRCPGLALVTKGDILGCSSIDIEGANLRRKLLTIRKGLNHCDP